MSNYHNDPPDEPELPAWVMFVEDALKDPEIPTATAFVIRTTLNLWYADQRSPDNYGEICNDEAAAVDVDA